MAATASTCTNSISRSDIFLPLFFSWSSLSVLRGWCLYLRMIPLCDFDLQRNTPFSQPTGPPTKSDQSRNRRTKGSSGGPAAYQQSFAQFFNNPTWGFLLFDLFCPQRLFTFFFPSSCFSTYGVWAERTQGICLGLHTSRWSRRGRGHIFGHGHQFAFHRCWQG